MVTSAASLDTKEHFSIFLDNAKKCAKKSTFFSEIKLTNTVAMHPVFSRSIQIVLKCILVHRYRS